jgi:hypothetical protein
MGSRLKDILREGKGRKEIKKKRTKRKRGKNERLKNIKNE